MPMQEFRRIVNQSDLKKDKEYKKFYIWATNRILSVQILYLAALCFMLDIGRQIFLFWRQTNIVVYRDIGGLMLVFLYLFWLLPRARFWLSRKKAPKVFGETYELIITEDGYQVNQQVFSWKGKKIIVCKRGIAVLSFWNILLMLPIRALSEEEYSTLKLWIRK